MRALPLLSALLISITAFAQTAVWKRFGMNDGLTTNTITAIAQDRNEVMWLGSQSGLIRFDGTSFKKIQVQKGVVQPYIQSILIDKQGNVWAGSRVGLWKYDILTREFRKLAVQNDINDMTWNADSSIIHAGTAAGLKNISIRTDTSVFTLNPADFFYRVYSRNSCLYSLCLSSLVRYDKKWHCDTLASLPYSLGFTWYEKEKCWIYCSRKNILAVGENGKIVPLKLAFNYGLLMQEQPAYADGKGNIWFNTTDTLYCYKSLNDTQPLKYFWEKDNPYSAPHIANRLYMANDNSMWIGTSGNGLAVSYPRIRKINFLPSVQVSSTNIWCMLHDAKEDKILFGTHSDVIMLDLKTGIRTAISSPKLPLGFTVTGILNPDSNYWYVSTYTGSGWRLGKKDLRYSRIPGLDEKLLLFGMTRESNSNILISSSIGVLHYNPLTQQSRRFPYRDPFPLIPAFCTIRLKNGNYAVGNNYGLTITNREKRIANYNQLTESSYLGVIFGIYESGNADIYVANMSGALYKLDHLTKKISHIDLAGSPTIGYSFARFSDSAFLLTTNTGLIYYNEYTGESKLLDKSNGLPFSDFDQFGISMDEEYFMCSGPEGAIQIKTSDLPSLLADRVDLRIQHNDIVTKSIHIPAGTQSLTAHIYIGAKQLVHALQYEYMLEGLESEWHSIEKGTEITYNYLPPGEYTLLVRASDPNHVVEPEQVSIPVIVVPLWYQTVWFRLLLVLIASVILIMAVRYISWLKLKWKLRKLEAEQKVADERMRISRELHDNVGSQLTYLITGLEASEMMLKQQKTQTLNDNLEQLQQSARDSMQQLRDSIWALNKEEMTITLLADRFRDWVHKMLAIQQTGFRFETDIEQEITLDSIKALNLFRLLQEAVHNVLKHAGATEIFITVLSRNNKISCQVHDNGKGFTIRETEESGLRNMHARAAECGGTLSIQSELSKGTTITFELNTHNG